MPFQKGKPKTGGRKKGTKNKTTCFIEACNKFDLDILACMIDDMKEMAPFQRVDYWAKLLEYYFPKKKEPTVISSGEEGFVIKVIDYAKKE